ncbi:hypothetical protein Tco_0872026 [Tanacetum coccineum]
MLSTALEIFLEDLLGLISFVSSEPLLCIRDYYLDLDKQSSVATKLRDSSLISSFRRPPRGGIKEEHLKMLVESTSSISIGVPPEIHQKTNNTATTDFFVIHQLFVAATATVPSAHYCSKDLLVVSSLCSGFLDSCNILQHSLQCDEDCIAFVLLEYDRLKRHVSWRGITTRLVCAAMVSSLTLLSGAGLPLVRTMGHNGINTIAEAKPSFDSTYPNPYEPMRMQTNREK